MFSFTHIKYGLALSILAILFGGLMGLSFGCCEDSYKDFLSESAQSVLTQKYNGDAAAAKKVTSKSWVYLKRAHLHSQTMGVIAIVISLLAAGMALKKEFQMGISILSGLGSLGYGVFWFLAALLAPGMGGTHQAKEAVGLIAQLSGGSFFVSCVALLFFFARHVFMTPQKEAGSA